MRLKLTLSCRSNSTLSLNYHYALQAVIYKTLQRADPVFSQWLHEKGYTASGKQFKLFTFSDLDGVYRNDYERGTIQFRDPSVNWCISFCVDEAMEKFITGLFQKQNFAVITPKGSVDFTVSSVEILETPTFYETMRYRTIMPICIAEQQVGRPQAKYLAPDEANYADLLFANLENKCKAAFGNSPTPTLLDFKILSDIRKRGMETIKSELNRPIKLIGYNYDFELRAPIEWQKIGYEAGFGKSSSGGFGMCKIL